MASNSSNESVSLSQILEVVKTKGENFERYQREYSHNLEELKREVVSNSQLQKFKSEAALKWRFEGNRIQHAFNEELLDIVKQLDWAFKYEKSDYLSELVSDLSTKLVRRNKLIRIADTSEGGWETVRQYENNPLADDSEDESRINRAESRALKKKKAAAVAKQRQKQSSGKIDRSRDSYLFRGQQSTAPYSNPYRPVYGWPNPNPVTKRGSNYGCCFACGSPHHWRNECPMQDPLRYRPAAAASTIPAAKGKAD